MKWIQWKDQNELAQQIKLNVDTGSGRTYLIESVLRDTKGKYTKKEINNEISNLIKKWLLIKNDGQIQVTEWAHDGLRNKFKHDHHYCLNRLKQFNVFHPDMIDEKIINTNEIPEEYKEFYDKFRRKLI